tara:strand:+ start:235 stop:432 length:198 start_codon:yes stop_codon:yes gene_type:complete
MLLTLEVGLNGSISNDNEFAEFITYIDKNNYEYYERVNISPYIIYEDIQTSRNIIQPIFRMKIKY